MATRRARRAVRFLGTLCGLLLLASACGRDDGGAGNGERRAGGLAPAPGFDGRTIKVGILTPETSAVAVIGIPLTDGNKVWFRHVNKAGGIAGRYLVEPVVEDTAYESPVAIQKYQRIKGDVVMLAQLFGTPVTNAVLPLLEQDGVVASPASLDAAWLTEDNLLPLGAPYQIQFLNAASYLVNEAGFRGKPLCVMAVEGPYGDAGLEGVEAAGRKLGFEIAATARYKATDQDFTAQVTQLEGARCAAVFFTGLPQHTGPVIGKGAQLGFTPQWVGQSPTWLTALGRSAQVAPLLQKTFLLAGEGPAWGDESVPGMRDLLADIRELKPDQQPDYYFIFGYLQGRAVTALLEKAVQRGDLSRAGIKQALAELGEVDFGGLSGRYTYGPPARRQPPRRTTIFRVDPAVPGFLAVVKEVESEAAREFRFQPHP